MSSNFSLRVINLFIGMCRGSKGVPDVLRLLGYADRWIERQFFNQDHEAVHPELILASNDRHHALLLEAKSGANTDRDQLRRYSRISSDDLRGNAFLSEGESRSHDLAVIGLSEHADRLRIGIEGEWGFPLILADDEGLSLDINAFAYQELSDVFRPTLEIAWGTIPMSWIPFDHGSDLWEVAEVVMPEVMGAMIKREPRIGCRSICQARSSWDIIGGPEKGQMEAKVRDVFTEAARREFSEYVRVDGQHLVIINNPINLDGARSTQALQKLERLNAEFLTRLRADGNQLELAIG